MKCQRAAFCWFADPAPMSADWLECHNRVLLRRRGALVALKHILPPPLRSRRACRDRWLPYANPRSEQALPGSLWRAQDTPARGPAPDTQLGRSVTETKQTAPPPQPFRLQPQQGLSQLLPGGMGGGASCAAAAPESQWGRGQSACRCGRRGRKTLWGGSQQGEGQLPPSGGLTEPWKGWWGRSLAGRQAARPCTCVRFALGQE